MLLCDASNILKKLCERFSSDRGEIVVGIGQCIG